MCGRRTQWPSWPLFFALSSLALSARAQNIDTFYLSGDAALQAGAITADVRGGGSIWYNPAGLAKLDGLRFDVNVSAYALGFGGDPDLEGIHPGAKVTRLSVLDLRAVPAAMSITKRFGEVGVGFGLFVPNQDATYLRTQVQQDAAGGLPAVEFGVHVDSAEKEYFGGPSFGIELGPAVDIGGSLFVHYRTDLAVSAIDVAVDAGDYGSVAVTSHNLYDSIQVGVQPVFGVQLHPAKNWQLGIALRLPSFRVYQILQTIVAETSNSSSGEGIHNSEFSDNTGVSTSLVKPPRFHVGFSYDFGPTRLAVEGNYQFPLHQAEIDQDLGPLFNVRLGAKHQLKDTLQLGGGLFTNRSATRDADRFGDTKIDYYGLTAAVHFGTPYEVAQRGSKKLRPFGWLNFGSTIALNYAIGLGEVVRAQVGLDADTGNIYREVQANVTAHEFVLTWASSISE
jgi:hypothetical protein